MEKSGTEKRENKVNSTWKINVCYTVIYAMTIKIFANSNKDEKKKNVYTFLIRKHPYKLN